MPIKVSLISLMLAMLVACGGITVPEVAIPLGNGADATAVVVDATSVEVVATAEVAAEPAPSTTTFVTANVPTMDGAYYQLQSKLGEANNLCLEGQGGAAPGSGAVLDGAGFMDKCANVSGQLWKVLPRSDGYYQIQNLIGEAQNLCLEGNRLAAESVLGGASVMIACQEVSGQQWRFVDAGDDYYYLQAKFLEAENKCLDGQAGVAVGSGAVLDGSAFMNDCQASDSQLWKIRAVSIGLSEPVASGDTNTASVESEPTATEAAEVAATPVADNAAPQFSVECAPEYVSEIVKIKDEVMAEIALERDEATQKDGIQRPPLIWNDQLACQSQEWAQAIATGTHQSNPHCCYGPIPIHSDTGSWKQPAAEGISMGKTATEGVRLWRDIEMENFDFSASEAAKRKDHTCIRQVCGHYGAIIGLFTTEVGCGFYLDLNEQNKNNYNFVCQYIFNQTP